MLHVSKKGGGRGEEVGERGRGEGGEKGRGEGYSSVAAAEKFAGCTPCMQQIVHAPSNPTMETLTYRNNALKKTHKMMV